MAFDPVSGKESTYFRRHSSCGSAARLLCSKRSCCGLIFLIFIVGFALIDPYCEETFWRGLLRFLPAGNKVTILCSASLFGFSHYFLWGTYWLANPPGKWIAAVVTTFIMGILWLWFYKRGQKLIYTILSHILVVIFNLSVAMFYGVKMVTI